MSIVIPVPVNLEQVLWFALGILFGRTFAKPLDADIHNSPEYAALSPFWKYIVTKILEFTHHWWVGALLMLYAPWTQVFWFGAGLLSDDLPDVPGRLISALKKTGQPSS